MQVKWVIFDLYNTLIDDEEVKKEMIEHKILHGSFLKNGINIPRQKFYEIEEYLRTAPKYQKKRPKNTFEQELAKLAGKKISLKKSKKINEDAKKTIKSRKKLKKGAKETLIWLRKNGIKCGVISNGHQNTAVQFLKKFRISKFIDDIITSEKAKSVKSEIKPFKYFLKKHELKPSECIMVGDEVYEDACSQKVGISAAIFEYNLSKLTLVQKNKLKTEGLYPKYRINSLDDIIEIVNQGER
jgi:HAD superfamily hydrolase (TIGR01549 family)